MIAQLLSDYPLVDIALRCCVLLIITFGVALACRHRSAAVIHRIWAVGLCGCLIVPPVTLLLPNWAVPVLPSRSTPGPIAAPATAHVSAPARFDFSQFQATPARRVQAPAPMHRFPQDAFEERPSVQEFKEHVRPTVAASGFEWPWPATWLFIAWCFGAGFVACRLIQQVLTTRRIVQRCTTIRGERWSVLRDAAARQLGVRTTVALKSHPGAFSPMVAGLLRPVVLLPSDAQAWSLERQRHVLLHELAHIQRRDAIAQSIAGIACAIYWFNPLTWWGAAQMKRLREVACDDVVVTHTTQPSNYAQTLLDVAKGYRCRQPICTVAMARTANVESRIGAILDATRRRASLTKRSAGIITTIALVVATLIGSLQLRGRADDPKETPAAEDAPAERPDDTRAMTIRVLDETGQPLPAGNVHASIWEIGNTRDYPNRDYPTNADGEANIVIPHRLRILRIWPSKAGYVPQFVNFAEGTHEEGRLIPDEYEFRLQPAHRLSGLVVDAAGNPISGAKVEVRVDVPEPFWGANPEPMISTWLATGEDAVATDEDGRWEITNAPGPKEGADYSFRLQVTHPDFAGDMRWGELQEQQGITTEQLRAGTARLTMDRGVAITGLITGPDGEPVTKGLVIWHDGPFNAPGVNETQIDEQGRYETLKLKPGEYPVTVVAPGYAPDQRKVQVSQSLPDVDFQLKPGHPIRLEFVDQSGNPVPEVQIRIGRWRGTEAIYNYKHSNVLESGIPRQANQDGVYEWSWAPADTVTYVISATGYDVKEVALVAKEEPHRIELAPLIRIFGNVVDAESGEPIERFRVIPVKAFRPEFYSTDFQGGRIAHGKDGVYEIQMNSHGQSGNRYRVRIEAEGYRTAFGQKTLAVGDPPLQENFKLERAPALVGRVLDPNGNQVNEFTVAVGTPTTSPQFSVDRPDSNFGVAFPVQGANEFRLPATFEPRRIRVFNDSGFAEVLRQPDELIGTINLEPWASVSGRLVQDGQPIPNEWIYFHPLAERTLTEARFQDSFSAKTDPNGYFRFDRLPPMKGTVKAYLGPWRESVLTSSKSVPLDLKPGDNVEVSLGGEGATITGRVVATGRSNDELSKQWSLNYLVSRDRGVAYPSDAQPLGFGASGPLDPAWLRQPYFAWWLATRENHFVKLAGDGRLRIHGVGPGAYDLVIQLYEQPAGCLVETIGEKVIPVTITEDDIATGQVEMGDIEVACRIGPRVGADMRAFEFIDSSGQVRLINDMSGRYVLFHVWASWCGPCLETMPQVKSTVEQYSDDPLTVVGLNVDKDSAAAKALAQEGGWSWAQNYLGDDSDMMRQLAVSSVPAYYLIGPDGKLIRSANVWTEIAEQLSTELR